MISAATRTRMIATRIQNSQTRKFGTLRHMLMSLSTARQDGKYANDRRNRAGSSCEVIAGQCRSAGAAGAAGGRWPNAAKGRATAGVAAMRIRDHRATPVRGAGTLTDAVLMRAVVCDRYGPPDVLRLEGGAPPVPKDEQ